MKKFSDLNIFDPAIMVVKNGFPINQKEIRPKVKEILLRKLTKIQVGILEKRNYFYWDPNDPEDGKEQGLLEHLICNAMVEGITVKTLSHFYNEFFLYDLQKYSGISEIEVFKKEIENINRTWEKEKVADIGIIKVYSGNSPEIFFRLT